MFQKWVKFLNNLSAKNFCISPFDGEKNLDSNSITQLIDGGILNSTNLTTITVSATVSFIGSVNNLPDGYVAVTGDVPLGDWVSLSNYNHPLNSLKMTFGVPPDLKKEDACVILTVPVTFLSLSKRSSVCIPTFLNKTITHVSELSAIVSGDHNSTCKLGYLTNLNFHSDEDFYLSKIERLNIYLRLFHASYFLLAVAFTLICFSLFRGRNYMSVETTDKVPLAL